MAALSNLLACSKKLTTTKPMLKKIAMNKKIIIDKYSDKKL